MSSAVQSLKEQAENSSRELVAPKGSPSNYAAENAKRLLESHSATDRQAVIDMLAEWAIEDAQLCEEEFQRNREVLRAIDSHRPHRRLFDAVLADE